MRRVKTFWVVSIITIVLVFNGDNLAWGNSYNLKAVPLSGSEIKLSWSSTNNERFDLWQSANGIEWYKIFTSNNYDSYSTLTSVYFYTYNVGQGIFPYRNYYFAVTLRDSVTDYPSGVDLIARTENEAVAYPPNQISHGSFTKGTNLCANCHSLHIAAGPKLMRFATVNDLCISCHDGTGSKFDVVNGTVASNGMSISPLKSMAGPFGAINNRVATAAPISIHNLDTPLNSAPGGNPASGLVDPMNCSSCHDPHMGTNFRSLRKSLPDNPEVTVKAYAETNIETGIEKPYYLYGINDFCKGCHKDYMAGSSSGSIPAQGTYQTDGKYRHPVGVSIDSFAKGPLTTTLPLEGNLPNNSFVACITCHFAHGSESKTKDPSNYLLKKDYRGICEDCHKK